MKTITVDTYIKLQINCFFKLAEDLVNRKSRQEPDFEVCKAFVDKWLLLNNVSVE